MRSSSAARRASAAPRIAETTAIPSAPAAAIEAAFPAPIRTGVPLIVHDRDADGALDPSDALGPEDAEVRLLRRRGERGPRADIVRAVPLRPPGLVGIVDRNPDRPGRSEDAPDQRNGQVILAEVDARRSAGQGDVQPVVDDERDARPVEDAGDGLGQLDPPLTAASTSPGRPRPAA